MNCFQTLETSQTVQPSAHDFHVLFLALAVHRYRNSKLENTGYSALHSPPRLMRRAVDTWQKRLGGHTHSVTAWRRAAQYIRSLSGGEGKNNILWPTVSTRPFLYWIQHITFAAETNAAFSRGSTVSATAWRWPSQYLLRSLSDGEGYKEWICIATKIYSSLPLQNISSKSVPNYLSNLTHRENFASDWAGQSPTLCALQIHLLITQLDLPPRPKSVASVS